MIFLIREMQPELIYQRCLQLLHISKSSNSKQNKRMNRMSISIALSALAVNLTKKATYKRKLLSKSSKRSSNWQSTWKSSSERSEATTLRSTTTTSVCYLTPVQVATQAEWARTSQTIKAPRPSCASPTSSTTWTKSNSNEQFGCTKWIFIHLLLKRRF